MDLLVNMQSNYVFIEIMLLLYFKLFALRFWPGVKKKKDLFTLDVSRDLLRLL